jgi:hypothetical protein
MAGHNPPSKLAEAATPKSRRDNAIALEFSNGNAVYNVSLLTKNSH